MLRSSTNLDPGSVMPPVRIYRFQSRFEVQFPNRRFFRSRLARALIVRAAREATSPRSPPMARRPMVVEILGNIPQSVQLPFELPPEPPFPPLDPPGAAWFTWIPSCLLVGVEGY